MEHLVGILEEKGEWVGCGVDDFYGMLGQTREHVNFSICVLCLFLPATFGSSISIAHVQDTTETFQVVTWNSLFMHMCLCVVSNI